MPVGGANSLQVESEPGKLDFHPLECKYGQFFRFNGLHCAHHTVANSTQNSRVSFDFRVVPASVYQPLHHGYIGDFKLVLARPLTGGGSVALPSKASSNLSQEGNDKARDGDGDGDGDGRVAWKPCAKEVLTLQQVRKRRKQAAMQRELRVRSRTPKSQSPPETS